MANDGVNKIPRITGFPPVAGKFGRVLILGSMPGSASLARNEYYGLPQNAFWRIMGDLFGAGPGLPYADRLTTLTHNGVVLWDVLESCYRSGSLDSAIDGKTARTNDFEMLFREHREMTHVFFNGRKAADLFGKRVRPKIEEIMPTMNYATLPSTSPAHASMDYEQKLERWAAVKSAIDRGSAP